jgi:hypothetical protein
MTAPTRDSLRGEKYPEAARAAESGAGCGCGPGSCCESNDAAFGERLYSVEQRDELPDAAVLASLGCGQVAVEFTHQVADGMHGAIVKAVKR